ncbi:hypothetical protein MASR1M36_20800 [Candidatus Cloacimonadaceae bacterium]
MTNTSRNSLVLLALLVAITAGSYMGVRKIANNASKLVRENKRTTQMISVLDSEMSNIDSLRWEYDAWQAMKSEQKKVLLSSDNPTTTYRYLLRMLSWMQRNIYFNFALTDDKADSTRWNEYILSGRADYRDVFEFAKNLEYQRAILTLEEIALGSDGVANNDSVSFSFVVRTHFSENGVGIDEIKPVPDVPTGIYNKSFKSRVFDTPMEYEDLDPSLARVHQCSLIGITRDQVFLKDSQGVIKILGLKGKVAFGYLDTIDFKANKAVFKLFQYGIPEEYSLYLINNK